MLVVNDMVVAWYQVVALVVGLLAPLGGLFFGVDAYLRGRPAGAQAWPPALAGVVALLGLALAVWGTPLAQIVLALPMLASVEALGVLTIALMMRSAAERVRDPQPLSRGLFIGGLLLGLSPWLGLLVYGR